VWDIAIRAFKSLTGHDWLILRDATDSLRTAKVYLAGRESFDVKTATLTPSAVPPDHTSRVSAFSETRLLKR
jgi:hypothetical protein